MNIIFTLITGSVGGALSSAMIQYFLKGCEIKKEKQRKVFENYLEQLQRYINSGNQGLENFQKKQLHNYCFMQMKIQQK